MILFLRHHSALDDVVVLLLEKLDNGFRAFFVKRLSGIRERHREFSLKKNGAIIDAFVDKMERDPQLAARDFYPTATHPVLGEHRFEGYPVHFSNARWRLDGGAPLFGGDNHDVLTRLLGYSDDEVATLLAEAAI